MFVDNGRIRKPIERERARELREQGMPIKRIASTLGVSPSSVSHWTRDIELTPDQRERNRGGPRGTQSSELVARRGAAWRKRNQQIRLGFQEEGRARARIGDAAHMAGCLLHWAEGAKNRNPVRFVNSDLAMVHFFVEFLRTSLGVRSEHITVRLNVYTGNGLSIREIENHWLKALRLPRSALRGHTLNHTPTSSSGRRTNHLPYGVCCFSVLKSTRLVQHIYGAIQEYAGFEEPRWLDGPPVKRRPRAAPAGPSGRGGGSPPRRRPQSARRTARSR